MALGEIIVAIFVIKKKKACVLTKDCKTLETVTSKAFPVGREEGLNEVSGEGVLRW